MSQTYAAGSVGTGNATSLADLTPRRKLQLALGVIWLLDGILQYQAFMYSKAFPQMLASGAAGNPAILATPITWNAGFIAHNLTAYNTIFATIQVAIGLGIAWRPAVKPALAASVVWALGVWWFGEGFNGILTSSGSSPVAGAPGAVIIYGLLAVLLWPADREAPFEAARAVGRRTAQALWLILWTSLAYFALLPASRAPHAISQTISGMVAGEPGWLSWIDSHAASALSGQGLAASIVLSAACGVVALGTYLPSGVARAAVVLAIVVAAALWLAEGLGGIFTGSGTDPNTGPLLALLALTFWPVHSAIKQKAIKQKAIKQKAITQREGA
ncbi:MAG TPA: hypothetical protein VN969_37800 [Streptosporangiaceae bacterium]|nr:hypothetical protein [Streptosporangiaceae bacterium]